MQHEHRNDDGEILLKKTGLWQQKQVLIEMSFVLSTERVETAWPDINVRREEVRGFHLLDCDVPQLVDRVAIGVARDVGNDALVVGKMLLESVASKRRQLVAK